MNFLQRNNVQIIGSSRADAPVLLYAHGFGCSQRMWRHITPAFEASHRQVLFDYVGSGQSDFSAFDARRYASLEGYVQDLLEVCDALQLRQGVHFMGHSVSATIGLLASIERPGLFESLVLVGPSPCFLNDPPDYQGGFEQRDLEELLELMDQNYLGWANYLAPVVAGAGQQEGIARELSESFCSTDPVMTRAFAQATFFADHRADLPRVAAPCLILQHRQDALVPLAVGEYLQRRLSRSTLEILDVTGHCAHMSHPGLVVDATRRFLGGLGA